MSHPTEFWLQLLLKFHGDGAALCRWVNESPWASLNVLKVVSGVPRQLTSDDNYRGYFLPKGSTVFFNAWFVVFHLRVGPRLTDFQGNYPERGALPRAGEVRSRAVHRKDGFGGGLPG